MNTTSNPFDGSKLKIKRADEHVRNIGREIAAFFQTDPYDLVTEPDPQSGDRIAKIKLAKPLPDELFIVIGETGYHLRSCLDLMIHAMVRHFGDTPTYETEFPFEGDKQKFESERCQRKIKLLPQDIRAMVADLKPYRGGDNILWGLGRLANIDRHRTLVPVAPAGSIKAIQHIKGRGGVDMTIDALANDLCEGIPIFNLGKHGTIKSTRPGEANFKIAGDIAFGDVDVFKGKPIVPTLHQLTQLTAGIVQTFETHCVGLSSAGLSAPG